MERADLILSHAGAGSLLEALDISSSTKPTSKQKKIVNAVINSKLMDNHQLELADELEKRKHICVTRDCISEWTSEDLAAKFWENIGGFVPVPFLGGVNNDGTGQQDLNDCNENVSGFQRIVDRVMGFNESWTAGDSTKKKLN